MLKIKNIEFKEKFAEAHLRQRIYEGTSYITLMATIEFYPKFVNDSILSGALDIKVDMKDIHALKDLENKELSGDIGSVTISVNNDDIWEHEKSDNFSVKLGKIRNRELEITLKTEKCELNTKLELISLYTTSSKEEELKESFLLDGFYSKTLEKKVGTSQIVKYFISEQKGILMNELIERIKKDLKELLSDYRYEHSLRVGEVSKELAHIYHVDEEKAYLAGMIHDIAKEFTEEQNEEIMKRNHQTINNKENPRINHAIVGAVYAKEKYHLDEEIIHAISSHTIGDIPMTMLDKIVFVADKIEPGKNYLQIEEERRLAKENLDKAMILCLENNHKKLKQENKKIASKSIEVLSYLKKNI